MSMGYETWEEKFRSTFVYFYLKNRSKALPAIYSEVCTCPYVISSYFTFGANISLAEEKIGWQQTLYLSVNSPKMESS